MHFPSKTAEALVREGVSIGEVGAVLSWHSRMSVSGRMCAPPCSSKPTFILLAVSSNDGFVARCRMRTTGQLLPVVVSAPKQTLAYLDFSIAAVRR